MALYQPAAVAIAFDSQLRQPPPFLHSQKC